MRVDRRYALLLATLAGLAANAAPASAETIAQSFAISGAHTTSTGLYFDSSLGTLESLTFSTTLSTSGQQTITNTGTTEAIGSTTDNFSLADATSSTIDGIISARSGGLGANLLMLDFDIPVGSSVTFTTADRIGQGMVTDTRADDLSAFSRQGGGVYALSPFVAHYDGVLTRQGFVSKASSLAATGTFAITYSYTPFAAAAPEPAAWAMMFVGLGITGGALRRRRTPRGRTIAAVSRTS